METYSIFNVSLTMISCKEGNGVEFWITKSYILVVILAFPPRRYSWVFDISTNYYDIVKTPSNFEL